MPKRNVDYSKTIIYKLVNYDCPELSYIGSTTNRTRRKQQHKCCATNSSAQGYNFKVYKIIRENGGWESWHMINIKEFPCANKREAEAEEDRIIQELKANMNSKRAYQTKKAYREVNKEILAEKNKEYQVKNKDIISIKRSEKIKCMCGCMVSKRNIASHKKSLKHIKIVNDS